MSSRRRGSPWQHLQRCFQTLAVLDRSVSQLSDNTSAASGIIKERCEMWIHHWSRIAPTSLRMRSLAMTFDLRPRDLFPCRSLLKCYAVSSIVRPHAATTLSAYSRGRCRGTRFQPSHQSTGMNAKTKVWTEHHRGKKEKRGDCSRQNLTAVLETEDLKGTIKLKLKTAREVGQRFSLLWAFV